MRTVRMLDLHGEYRLFADEVRSAVDAVLESQRFIGGPAVAELETVLSRRIGVSHAIAVSNGSDALLCTFMALGITRGDEVIVPAFTFFATAGSVARVGAKPVFVDIDPNTFNVDPSGIEAAVTDKTKAILAVHLFGQCAEMDSIKAIAARHGLAVVEDAAQAFGATYQGRPAGALGDVGCLSFYPTKNLGGFGEGGMIFTNDDPLAETIRQLRRHGESQRYRHERVGGNFRLDTMKAAVLLVKLRYVDEFLRRRGRHASRYDALLDGVPVQRPYVAEHRRHAYHQYSVLCDHRDGLVEFLRDRGVETGVYYPVPLHLQPCFASLGYDRGALPAAERTCERIVSLPCHPMLGEEDLEEVAAGIRDFFGAVGVPRGGDSTCACS